MSAMETVAQSKKILFVYLANPKFGKSAIDHGVTELWNLVESMGNAVVMDLFVQKGTEYRDTFIGPGKVNEIAEYLKTHPIDIVICNGQLTPTQKFTLTKFFWDINPRIQVWDRIDLILAIFDTHASTQEAKLQIELGRMRHMGPAIFGMGMILSRQGGGVGTRGIGETNTELMKRHWKREMKRVTDALEHLVTKRQRDIDHRKTIGLQTVSLVGYTNAGKTSLFNLLTKKKHRVDNILFATLDSTVGELYLPKLGKSVLISDTIGFIQGLPPDLIDAFKSTLLESVNADVVLHIIDASSPDMMEKIDVVEKILEELHIPGEKVVLVYNKIDAAAEIDRKKIRESSRPYPYVFASAITHEGIDALLTSVLPDKLAKNF